MQWLRSQSFDLYGRYSHVWLIRTQSLPAAPLRILDVGDPFGTIASIFPDDHTFSLDIYSDNPPTDGVHQHLIGSGFELPFVDASFDLVCTHDVLEHIPAARRTEFIAELLRVSAGPVVLVAPFADERLVRVEHLVNSYFVAKLGHTLSALDEHSQCGLPDPVQIVAWLEGTGTPFARFGDGWLYHWVALYYLKAHMLSRGAEGQLHALDRACNELLLDVDHTQPHYRTTLVLRPPASVPELPSWTPPPPPEQLHAEVDELTELAMSLSEALVPTEDPAARDRNVAAWIAARAASSSPAQQLLASSLTVVLDKLREISARDVLSIESPSADPATCPRIAVVMVSFNGIDHLVPCLESLRAQDYPAELTEVIVVDNGSTDGSLELLEREYPWVRVLPQGHNTGFAVAVTVGVAAATAECVAFINNDMRADPGWLRALVAAYDPDHGVVCVAGQIRSWDGERVDFVDGVMNFYGMGSQVGYGKPLDAVDVRDGQPLLFACGGSMLVSRHIYLTSGGFDPAFFAYFEDVDFGWRLWLLGYEVRFAEDAITYHRMHGTSSRFALHQRMVLYERNALRSIMKNYGDDTLSQVLAPALLLLMTRAVERGELAKQRDAYEPGGDVEATEVVPRVTLSHLHAVNDLVHDLDALVPERARIQRARKREDSEIVELFGTPFAPVLHDPDYEDVQRKLIDGFGLAEMFQRHRASRVLCVSANEIGEEMSGSSIRTFEIAKALSSTTHVAAAAPGETDYLVDDLAVLRYSDEATLVSLAANSEVVLIQGHQLREFPRLANLSSVLVIDLYEPFLFENLELHGESAAADLALRQDVSVLNELLDAGDYFICASERQRDYWLGMLSARGKIDSATYAADPTLRQLIDVVPFGLPSHKPRHPHNVLKGVHPAVGEDDLVVLWGGGVWDWFDPLSVVEAFNLVLDRVPNAKLYFLGLHVPSVDAPSMKMADAALLRAKELGLYDTSIIFGDWAPYEIREAFLRESDIAVSSAKDLAETRLAFRSQILDYLWAGLPVVTTTGDVLADLVERHALGLVVPPGDVNRLAAAMVDLLSDAGRRAEVSARAVAVADGLRWANCVAPLRKVVLEPWRWRLARGARERRRLVTQDLQIMLDDRDAELDRVRANNDELRANNDELVFLRQHAAELEAIVAHKDRPYALARKAPGARSLAALLRRVRRYLSA
ncbi:MAG: glycosyltransferase [Actinobacteria bacterium]|nr:glycosyltransferase [Actinomycetota bacterium]